MNLSLLSRRAVAPFLVATAIASSAAQEPRRLNQPDSIPLDLATALISAGGLGGEPQILVGSMPGWMTSKVYVAPNARILGSAFIGTNAVVIVSTADMPDVAIATLKKELATRGWKAPPPTPQYGGGFRYATMNMGTVDLTRASFCGADQQFFTASAVRRRGVSTDIVMRISVIGGYSACNPPQMNPGYRPSPLPTVYHATGTSETPGCSNEMGFGSNGTQTTVHAAGTNESLLDYYGKQLQDSGWQAPAIGAGSIVGRTWTRPDSTGTPTELTITATSSPRDPACRTLQMTLRTLKKP